jgi:putative ATP-dependent endonuclease of OLD family
MLPLSIVSGLPWNNSLDGFMQGGGGRIFECDQATGRVAARSWFDEAMAGRLAHCYDGDADAAARVAEVQVLRHSCRILPTSEDESELGFHGRRVRGEIFFARRWILVEGVTEYLLVQAIGKALGLPLDTHGIAVIDFQQSGSAGIYPALAEAFGIPWHMITDGDHEAAKFKQQILDRGFVEADLVGRFETMPAPNGLEDQLLADGHEQLLRQILASISGQGALTCHLDEFRARLKNRKTGYMGVLSLRVAADPALAQKMPAPFVNLINSLKGGA